MNLADVNHTTLSKQLEKEVPEVVVVVAKHRVAGLDTAALAELISVDERDITELESDPLYIEVRGIIGVLTASQQADQGPIWDDIESVSSRRLLERIGKETDVEVLARVAGLANKMTRRNRPQQGPLEPGLAQKRVGIQLTRRMVERLTGEGEHQRVTEERLSIHDGSMQNPTFDEVNNLLGLVPKTVTAPADVSLLRDMGFEEAA